MKKLISLCFLVFIVSCANNTHTKSLVNIPDVVSGVQQQVAISSTFPSSGMKTWNLKQKLEFTQAIMSLQCKEDKSDPTLAVVLGDMNLSLVGSYQRGGQLNVGNLEQLQTVSFNVSSHKSDQQTVNLPLSLIALTTLPDKIYNQRSNYLGIGGLSSSIRKELEDDRKTQQVFIDKVVKSYNPQLCQSSLFHRSATFLGVRYRKGK